MAGQVRFMGCSKQQVLLLALVQIALLGLFFCSNRLSQWVNQVHFDDDVNYEKVSPDFTQQRLDRQKRSRSANVTLPLYTSLSNEMRKINAMNAQNQDIHPHLARENLIIVLYVHNRPRYLQFVVDGLSKVEGINETLLIVSHDGFYPEMNEIVQGIKFCQVKQIFAPFSPHLFPESFPGTSPGDCKEKTKYGEKNCIGEADQYGNHRSPRIVSLKHHWWWMMNTVWDGLMETHDYDRHIVFIEEDHYVYPNAYRNLQALCKLKNKKCPDCYTTNLAPWDIKSRGEQGEYLIADKIGNVGYAFNRTVWNKILGSKKEFCYFDDYNWDVTLWAAVYPSWQPKPFTLRGPRTSAIHFGKCGLHQGKRDGEPECKDFSFVAPNLDPKDEVMNINQEWRVVKHHYNAYAKGFKGWGGWGDSRDHKMCMEFASMYHS